MALANSCDATLLAAALLLHNGLCPPPARSGKNVGDSKTEGATEQLHWDLLKMRNVCMLRH